MRGVKNEDLDFGVYCKCGSEQEAEGIPDHVAGEMEESFWERHSGEGHGEVSKEECQRIRRRKDKP